MLKLRNLKLRYAVLCREYVIWLFGLVSSSCKFPIENLVDASFIPKTFDAK